MCQSLFLNKVAGCMGLYNKRGSGTGFFGKSCEIFKITYFEELE